MVCDLFGGSRTLRASHEALMAMEGQAGIGLMQLTMKSAYLSHREVTAIIYAGLLGAGETIKFEEVGNKVLDFGFNKCFKVAVLFLTLCFKGPEELEKKTEAEAATKV